MVGLIYAQSHADNLPEATDVWDYARILAEEAGLDDAHMWQSRSDFLAIPLASNAILDPSSITRPRALSPDFKKIKPAFAVALGKLTTSMPATTPIAWTRGLQPDGTWAKHSPYGTDGGYIVFIGGNITFYKNLGATVAAGELTRFDGQGPTNNIHEALPPGTRIGEYVPTAEEQASWSIPLREFNESMRAHSALIALALLWLPFVAFSIHRFIHRRPADACTLLLWPLIITILLSIIIPTC